jgi:glutamate-ammonia-ligase adenylyltransferase
LLQSARPGAGADALIGLADASRQERGRPLDPEVLAPLSRVLGSSPFLARLLQRHPEWTDDLAGEPPPDPAAPAADWAAIRTTKYRGLLRVAARDLGGRSMDGSLRELSDLADGCLGAALTCAVRERGGEPPALFAVGKLGGRELNFSSDVDVLFLYLLRPDEDELARARQVQDVVRSFKSGLEERTQDGFGYRVDLDLRPEGRVGTLANPVEAALSYYEAFGADWERQMLIRLRPIFGSKEAQESFVHEITPFVYRGLIDPGAIAGVREIKLRIEAERRAGGVDLEADLKEGPGGIRDVEFLVQALQLIRGGREPALRTGNVLDALAALGQSGALAEAIVESLIEAYRWLRRAEHALQMAEERQTQRFPRDARGQLELARRMGYHDGDARVARDRLLDDWTNVRAEVRRHFESLLLGTTETEGGA